MDTRIGSLAETKEIFLYQLARLLENPDGLTTREIFEQGRAINICLKRADPATYEQQVAAQVIRHELEPAPNTFQSFSIISQERNKLWVGAELWTVVDWSNAFAGEAGELCNAIKKFRRFEMGMQQAEGPVSMEQAIAGIRKEVGDAYTYLDLLCVYLGLDTFECIREAFNQVSAREGFPQRV